MEGRGKKYRLKENARKREGEVLYTLYICKGRKEAKKECCRWKEPDRKLEKEIYIWKGRKNLSIEGREIKVKKRHI